MTTLDKTPTPIDISVLKDALQASPELEELIDRTYAGHDQLLEPLRIAAEAPEEFAEALKAYNRTLWWIGEKLDISYRQIEYVYRRRLHYLRVSRKAELREALEAPLLSLTDRPASECFFSPAEASAALRPAIRTEVFTVAVPFSLFASNPDAFREEFRTELGRKYGASGQSRANYRSDRIAPIEEWECAAQFKPEERLLLGSLIEDLDRVGALCGVPRRHAYSKLPAHQVELPGKLTLPAMKSLTNTGIALIDSRNCAMSERAVRQFGWARHTFAYEDKLTGAPTELPRYSPGLALGERRNWADYEIGAFSAVTYERAKAFFGEGYLLRRWNFTARECLCYDVGGRE